MTAHTHAQATSETTPAPARTLQRACACGESTGVSGKCPECEAEERLGVQAKLRVNRPGDRWEQEADRIADEVVSARPMPARGPLPVTPLIQRQELEDDEEELQAKPAPGGGATHQPSAAGTAAEAVAGGGRPLAPEQRGFFEPRLGRDLSAVRIHDDARAGAAARGIGASAYTLCPHIAFAPGQFAPGTQAGRRLLAHELVHTMQQGGEREIRRTCPSDPAEIPAGSDEDFERRVDEALEHETYKALDDDAKEIAQHIIDGARASECPMYYIEKLHLLLNTQEKPPEEQAAEARAKTREAAKAERARLETWSGRYGKTRQEGIASEFWRFWTTLEGRGATFRVDRSDPDNIVVQLRVRLTAEGAGTEDDVQRTKDLEDAIEIAGSSRGYTLDIDFTDDTGTDVFEAGVDPSKWTTHLNWVGNPEELAHEAHHVLGLHDRYNYIESQAGNPGLNIDARLYWFREQMVRARDPLAHTSMMRFEDEGTINDEDVCAVAGGDYEDCLSERFDSLPINEIERRARILRDPYRPRHAAMLLLLRDAWESKDILERLSRCDIWNLSDCDRLPIDLFGNRLALGIHASEFPLTSPHEPPEGESLTGEKRSP